MDEEDIDEIIIQNKLVETDGWTYKLINEIANYSSIYEDANEIENINEIEAQAQKMLDAYTKYDIEETINIFNTLFNTTEAQSEEITETENRTLHSHTYTLNRNVYSYKLINRYLKTRGYTFASELEGENMKFTFYEDDGEYPLYAKFCRIAKIFPRSAEENESYKNVCRDGNTFTIERWYNYNIKDALQELYRLHYTFTYYYDEYNLVIEFEDHDLDAEDVFDFFLTYHYPSTENPCLDFKDQYTFEVKSEHLFYILQEINEAKWRITEYNHEKFMEAIHECYMNYLTNGKEDSSDFNEESLLKYYYGDEE